MKEINRQEIFNGKIVRLGLEKATLPNGLEVKLEIIRHPGAAAIVPIHPNGDVTLIRQYRHAAGGMIVEVPAGVLEKGEDPVYCAKRELAEEVQLDSKNYKKLGVIHTTPGFTDEIIHIYMAENVFPVSGIEPDWDEHIEPIRIPFSEALSWIKSGKITDAKSISAIHLAAQSQDIF